MSDLNPRHLNPLTKDRSVDTLRLCTEQLNKLGNTLSDSSYDVEIYYELMWIKGSLRYAAKQIMAEQAALAA